MKIKSFLKILLIALIASLTFNFGIVPAMSHVLVALDGGRWESESYKTEYDVIVVGDELDGVAAALASSRIGMDTLFLLEGESVEGSIVEALQVDLDPKYQSDGNLLNGGIFAEIVNEIGDAFTPDEYVEFVKKTFANEKYLDVLYNVKDLSVLMEDGVLRGIKIKAEGHSEETFYAKRFIDSSKDGKLLQLCDVPYFTGSADINAPDVFAPLKLNFVIKDVNWEDLSYILTSSLKGRLYQIIDNFEPADNKIEIKEPSFYHMGDGVVIFSGLYVNNVNPLDEELVNKRYADAVRCAKEITDFLKENITVFNNAEFLNAAEKLYISETRHFLGEYVLGVNEILENKDHLLKAAVGYRPVDAGKFLVNEDYIIGNPKLYSIPIGTLIPLNVDNLLMTGGKISYSSLAFTSSACPSVDTATGESAGLFAAHSILKDVSPRQFLKSASSEEHEALDYLFKRRGMLLPDFDIVNPNVENWSYDAVRKINELGLIASGMSNSYMFEQEATCRQFSTLLVGASYRSKDKDEAKKIAERLKTYYTEDKLSKEKAARILLEFHDIDNAEGDSYKKALEEGLLDEVISIKLDDREVLSMDIVYQLVSDSVR